MCENRISTIFHSKPRLETNMKQYELEKDMS